MCCDLGPLNKLAFRTFIGGVVLAGLFILVGMPIVTTAMAADFSNRILTLTPVQIKESGGDGIKIVAEKEIGSRYTSYLLSKPPRVVFDFQGADISKLPAITKLTEHSVREIRVSSFETASVKSGRIELILMDRVTYKVQKNGSILLVSFSSDSTPQVSQAVVPPAVPVAPPVVGVGMQPQLSVKPPQAEVKPQTNAVKPQVSEGKQQAGTQPQTAAVVLSSEKAKRSATQITEIIARKDEVLLRADGTLDSCKTFLLQKPVRFVADCYGVTEKIPGSVVRLDGAVRQVRVGNYLDKVRFVFEGDSKALAKLTAAPVADGLVLRQDGAVPVKADAIVTKEQGSSKEGKATAALPPPVVKTPPPNKNVMAQSSSRTVPVSVEKVDFKVEDGKSFVIVALSSVGEVMQPIKDKSLLRFGIKNASIAPLLRRTVDASAFPSVIRQITPYIVDNRGQYDVRFAVELKGDAPYELVSDGKVVTLIVENGQFTAQNATQDKIELPVNSDDIAQQKLAAVDRSGVNVTSGKSGSEVITNETLKSSTDKKYTGQLVSFNFDNIEIRNVLLLIAEVSDTNIIANDDVKGLITLRLNNVPWDQALDEIMQSKGLAMEREGNILRIAPKDVILKRKLDNAKITTEISVATEKETKAFSVNYGPVDDIAKKITAQLGKDSAGKDNGTVSSDARTRQIFVTTSPDKMKEIEEQIINRLDVPDKQVTIEARIVEANSNFTRDLGVSWGISQQGTANGPWDLNGAMITGGGSFTINPGTQATSTAAPVFNTSAGIGSQFSFGRIGIDSTILDLRLSALETSGYGKIVSTPRITTSNGEPAEISQGTQIPYQSTSEKGTETKFVDATLSLKVKPVINPDKSMVLEIEVSNDSIGSTVATGVGSAPSINTKKAKTKVMVKNGETTVIGGIFIETETESEAGIPLLRSLPFIGHLFKSTKKSKDKTELMIFITPRIVE